MAVIDLPNIVHQRLRDITIQNLSMIAEELYFDGGSGLWCLITIRRGDGIIVEYDFIESEESWKRTDAVIEYAEAAMEKVRVLVIVPDQALANVLELVGDFRSGGILVSDFSAMELIPLPLTY